MNAEQTRVFGKNADFLSESHRKLTDMGIPSEEAQEAFLQIRSAAGLLKKDSNLPNGVRSVLGWFNTVMILTLLTRASFNAIAEPLNVGIVTGSSKDSLLALAGEAKALFGRGNSKEWASMFESLGIIATGMDKITFTHRFNDMFDTPGLQNIANKAFRMSGMSALDRASRISAGVRGHAFLISSMRADTLNGNVTLKELGIAKSEQKQFLKWLESQDTVPDLDPNSNDKNVKMYTEAIHEFINITIQNPKAGDKPMLTNNPVGKIVFGLTSFSYSYQKNIIQRVGRRTLAVFTGKMDEKKLNAKERAELAMLTALPVLTAYAGVAAIAMVREGIADPERLEELLENGEFWKLAASRAGFFGAPDVLLQAWTGLKYRRDLTNSVVGASTGYTLQSLGDISRGFQAIAAGESTSRSNEKVIEGFYKLTIAPMMVTGSALLVPNSKLLIPAFGFFNAFVATSPGVRRSIAEKVVETLD